MLPIAHKCENILKYRTIVYNVLALFYFDFVFAFVVICLLDGFNAVNQEYLSNNEIHPISRLSSTKINIFL